MFTVAVLEPSAGALARLHSSTPIRWSHAEEGMPADSPWDASLDALIAAPGQHRLVFENAHVRVLDTRIGPGERTPSTRIGGRPRITS
jgi:hypothetical protein